MSAVSEETSRITQLSLTSDICLNQTVITSTFGATADFGISAGQ
jgi:hypothetical protein